MAGFPVFAVAFSAKIADIQGVERTSADRNHNDKDRTMKNTTQLELISKPAQTAGIATICDVIGQISYTAEILGDAKSDGYVELLEGLVDSDEWNAILCALPLILQHFNESIIAARRSA